MRSTDLKGRLLRRTHPSVVFNKKAHKTAEGTKERYVTTSCSFVPLAVNYCLSVTLRPSGECRTLLGEPRAPPPGRHKPRGRDGRARRPSLHQMTYQCSPDTSSCSAHMENTPAAMLRRQ